MKKRLDTPPIVGSTLTFSKSTPDACPFSDVSPPFHLVLNQTLEISFAEFPPATTLDCLAIRLNSDPSKVLFFPPSAGTSTLIGVYTVTASGPNGPVPSPIPTAGLVISIVNQQRTSTRQHYSMVLKGTQGGSLDKWRSDPELVNRISGGGQTEPLPRPGRRRRANYGEASRLSA